MISEFRKGGGGPHNAHPGQCFVGSWVLKTRVFILILRSRCNSIICWMVGIKMTALMVRSLRNLHDVTISRISSSTVSWLLSSSKDTDSCEEKTSRWKTCQIRADFCNGTMAQSLLNKLHQKTTMMCSCTLFNNFSFPR